ncbi:MAG TPA: alpha-amylase family glycosyl hydrolase [Gemmatimonadales bacterium]|jgi:glycosidase|nr:alpha-amylase family glycosyl hydrolase [Gemmatimonadales bacterium]
MRTRFALAGACLSLATTYPATAQTATAPDSSWVARGAIYEVFVRDYSPTGDLRGVISGLDRIQAAGANVVWLMPIYPVGVVGRKKPLGSPYSVRDYRAINPGFGTAAGFRALVQAVHARGMNLILDWVPNHTSWDHVWVREHPDFYVRDDRGGLTVPRDDKGKLTDWTDVAQLDYGNPALRREMIAAMQYWLTEFGVDGFRVDVAGFVPDDFWREAVPVLRAAAGRPILLLAEWGDLKMHRFGFDLTYGWDSYGRLKSVWKGAPASTFVRSELTDLAAMPPGGMRLRFTTNHDETAWDQPPVTLFGGAAGARAAFVAMALLPGRPLLYDGQEVESPQKLGLFTREPIAWNQPDAAAARAFYRRVMQLARTDSAFLAGDFRDADTTAPDDVIAYARRDALVLVNARSREVRVGLKGFAGDSVRDLLSDRVQRGDSVTLRAFGAVVLRRSPGPPPN